MLATVSRLANRYFVVVVLFTAILGYVSPVFFRWVGSPLTLAYPSLTGSLIVQQLPVTGVIVGLGLIMFGMGMTLSFQEIHEALNHPGRIGFGVLLQFLIMPLVAFLLAIVLNLSNAAALGVILVGCCPGGTASNVIAFLADADVPLSVAVTLTGTLLAPLVTPWLIWGYGQKLLGFYRGEVIGVPVSLLMTTILVIVVPVLVGLVVKRFFLGDRDVPRLNDVFTLLSIAVISLIVGYVVATASVQGQLLTSMFLFVPVALHNLTGLGLGYWGANLLEFPVNSVRSLSIEVGMQNSGLAVALADVLSDDILTGGSGSPAELALLAIPAVLFSVWHNITGPVLSSWWGSPSCSSD